MLQPGRGMKQGMDTGSDFGRHAPPAWMMRLLDTTRTCSASWVGKRLAFALRAVGIKALRGRPLDVSSLGARMRLYPAHNVAEKNLLFTPHYFDPTERRILAERLVGDFTFVDIGANAGGYALFVASLAGPRARILAIEPQPDIFERLAFNIRQNSFPSIKAYACAVADRDGEITLFIDEANRGESSMRLMPTVAAGRQVKVPAKALRTILAEEGFERIDAMKIDAEGAEELILEPFFRDTDPRLWPKLLILEMALARWSIDLPALIVAKGYRKILTTRTNAIYERD